MSKNVKTKCEVTVYEIDGEDKFDGPPLIIESHWNCGDRIIIRMPENTSDNNTITVLAADLIAAAQKCTPSPP